MTERMIKVLKVLDEHWQDFYENQGGWHRGPTSASMTPNEIAIKMGFHDGGRRRGNGAAGRGGWAGRMAPAQRIITPLRHLFDQGLVHLGRRDDGLSGTAYYITQAGQDFLANLSASSFTIRPLRRIQTGIWESRDGKWVFMRHESDPTPKRWFAYYGDDADPANEGSGHVTLAEVVSWAETRDPAAMLD